MPCKSSDSMFMLLAIMSGHFDTKSDGKLEIDPKSHDTEPSYKVHGHLHWTTVKNKSFQISKNGNFIPTMISKEY